jgi:hypothetical protein
MLSVTNAACSYLKNVLDHSHAPDGSAVRIVAKGNALATTIDTLHEGDSIVEYDGRRVLLLDPGVSERLAECTLDAEPDARTLLVT